MPELAMFDPRTLPRIVNEFEAPEEFLGLKILGAPIPETQPTWEYDIIRAARGASLLHNSPNSEAQIVDQLPFGHMQGAFAYKRDKKTFNATTLRWLRLAGESQAAAKNAEIRVMAELQDMRNQHQRAEELAAWAMFSGTWTYTLLNGATIAVDYGVPAAHQPVSSTAAWGVASDDPIGDILAWKQVVQRASGFPITIAYMNATAMAIFIQLAEVQAELSDRQQDMFTAEGRLPRFFGIDWIEYDNGYVDTADVFQQYIPDERILFLATGGTKGWDMFHGPSADLDAPGGWTGPFTKSWVDPDPSGRQILMEVNYMPVLTQPLKTLYADTSGP